MSPCAAAGRGGGEGAASSGAGEAAGERGARPRHPQRDGGQARAGAQGEGGERVSGKNIRSHLESYLPSKCLFSVL